MYISRARITTSKIISGFVIGGCSFGIFLNVLMLAFLFQEDGYSLGSKILVFSILVTAISGMASLIIWRIVINRRIARAGIYNSMIEEDHDGIITYETFSSMTGHSKPSIFKDLMWLRTRGYLNNITVGRNAVRVDLKSDEHDFVEVICPTCANALTIRRNGGGRCDHCGTFMRVKEDQNV